jgi:site-specific DNA-methyltransferase (adenine-specific)
MINQIIHGDCFDVLKNIPDNSIDLILTDPPYGLSFMGKDWDHGVPGVQFWIEALRVAKPGAHLFAFGGTRTFHRLAVAIEDAGWEIRDTIMWVYGSGFPKSHDVSKAIDKCNGETGRLHKFTDWMRTTGLTARQLDQITDTNMGGHYLTAASQPAIPTAALWDMVRPHCGEVPAWVDEIVQRIEAEREVVGKSISGKTAIWQEQGGMGDFNITAPATPEAKQWQGWGTALKPAWEPIIVARKPLAGTVAENVLQWGTGGINIDGCRVGTNDGLERPYGGENKVYGSYGMERGTRTGDALTGRWPANFIHDGSEEVVGLFPQTAASKSGGKAGWQDQYVGGPYKLIERTGYDEAPGSAARFFYCAKASKSERGEGNIHPTVKPLALMKYLTTLGLPPSGTVLDPFCGSGTTALACKELGRNYICIEKELEYYRIACNRLDQPIELIPDEPIEEIIDNSPLQLKLF